MLVCRHDTKLEENNTTLAILDLEQKFWLHGIVVVVVVIIVVVFFFLLLLLVVVVVVVVVVVMVVVVVVVVWLAGNVLFVASFRKLKKCPQ